MSGLLRDSVQATVTAEIEEDLIQDWGLDGNYVGDLSVDQIAQFIQSRLLAPRGTLP